MSRDAKNSRPASSSPGNLIDAISEIQRYYVVESTGQEIPSDFLTLRGTLGFFLAGFRSGFLEGILLALLLPLAFGVWYEIIPAFGTASSDFFGKCLVFLFSFGISLAATLMFIVVLPGYCGGALAKKAAFSLVWGRVASLTVAGIAIFFLVSAFLFFFGPENVFRFSMFLENFLGDPASLYFFIMEMREPFRKSAVFQLVFSPVLGLVPFAALRFCRRKRH